MASNPNSFVKHGMFCDGTRFIVEVERHRRPPEYDACNCKHKNYKHLFRCNLFSVQGCRILERSPKLQFGCKECDDDPASYYMRITEQITDMLTVFYGDVSLTRCRSLAQYAVDMAARPAQDEMTTYAFQQVQIRIYPNSPEESVGSCSV